MALVFSIISGLLGVAMIARYGAAGSGSQVPKGDGDGVGGEADK